MLDQSYENWELIIGVNGHEANSSVYQIAKDYKELDERIKVYDMHTIKGKSNALNEMVKYSNYKYIAILDVDDIWYADKLEKQVSYLNDYDVIGTQCVYFGNLENVKPDIPFGDISTLDFAKVNPVINSSSIIRKDLCYWNGEYDSVEDYDLWLRLRKQNKKFFNVSEVLVKHRIHQQSAFNSSEVQQGRLMQILNNYKFS